MKFPLLFLGALATSIVLTAEPPASPEFCVSRPDGISSEASAHSPGALHWEKTMVEVKASYGQKLVRTSYRFKHDGESPLSIVEIKPSCGCVATQLEKLEFVPGEKGELKVTLDLEMDEKVGLQALVIAVTTSDAPRAPTLLQLRVNVPEAVELSSDFVTWERGEEGTAKMISVHAASGVSGLKLKSPSGISEDFSLEVLPDVAGQSYQIKVTPKSTAAPAYAQVRLQAESTSFSRPVICKLNLSVK